MLLFTYGYGRLGFLSSFRRRLAIDRGLWQRDPRTRDQSFHRGESCAVLFRVLLGVLLGVFLRLSVWVLSGLASFRRRRYPNTLGTDQPFQKSREKGSRLSLRARFLGRLGAFARCGHLRLRSENGTRECESSHADCKCSWQAKLQCLIFNELLHPVPPRKWRSHRIPPKLCRRTRPFSFFSSAAVLDI